MATATSARPRTAPARATGVPLDGLRLYPGTAGADEALYVRVYRAVREALLSGGVAPGDLINIRPIAAQLGISPMPVREALARLVADGALESLANRAFRVPVIDVAGYRELLLIRLRLEGLAGEQAAVRIRPDQLGELRRLHARLAKEGPRSMRTYLALNRAFHFGVYRASGLPTLVATIETIWLRIGPLLHACEGPSEFESAVERHAAILEGLERGDPTAAGRAIERDLIAASPMVFAYLDAATSLAKALRAPSPGNHRPPQAGAVPAAPSGRISAAPLRHAASWEDGLGLTESVQDRLQDFDNE